MNKPKEINVKKSLVPNAAQNVHRSRINSTSKATSQNQNKSSNAKKFLVRNTERPVPESRVIRTYLTDVKGEQLDAKSVQVPDVKYRVETFEVPELYSTLDISKKIDSITNYRKSKSLFDADNKKLAFDEKVSRQVNFPYNQPVYKDLIPLLCDKVQTLPFTASRNPLPQKDKELVLADFVEPKKIENYYSLPSVEFEDKITPSRNNNLRLYKLLQINSR